MSGITDILNRYNNIEFANIIKEHIYVVLGVGDSCKPNNVKPRLYFFSKTYKRILRNTPVSKKK